MNLSLRVLIFGFSACGGTPQKGNQNELSVLSSGPIQSLPDGSDTDFHLVGGTNPDSGPGYLVLTDKGNLYWLDTVSGED